MITNATLDKVFANKLEDKLLRVSRDYKIELLQGKYKEVYDYDEEYVEGTKEAELYEQYFNEVKEYVEHHRQLYEKEHGKEIMNLVMSSEDIVMFGEVHPFA